MTSLQQITVGENELREIVEAVTAAFLRQHTYVAPAAGDAESIYIGESWTGCVCVNGAYNGAVTLNCTQAFVRHVARVMFGAEAAELSDDFSQDALAELTNVVGGNIKSLLSELTGSTCSLSLPTVSAGECTLPGARVVQECWCQCGDERLVVSVFEAAGSAAARA
jgi:chemotaxis protein CheX